MTTLVGRDSEVFAMAVELYCRHALCGEPACLVRANAAGVVRAAGLDPSLFNPPQSLPAWCMQTV